MPMPSAIWKKVSWLQIWGSHPKMTEKLIRLKVPPLSEERRKQLVSRAKEIAEESRISMRNVRRDANKTFETSKKDGGISEDELSSQQGSNSGNSQISGKTGRRGSQEEDLRVDGNLKFGGDDVDGQFLSR
ncbi:MAG: ribosome recycling factor [Planctomycetota bacterium]